MIPEKYRKNVASLRTFHETFGCLERCSVYLETQINLMVKSTKTSVKPNIVCVDFKSGLKHHRIMRIFLKQMHVFLELQPGTRTND